MRISADYFLLEKLRAHHSETYYHSLRVSNLCLQISRYLGWQYRDSFLVWRSGQLHDIGKIYVPHQLLSFPGPLEREQYERVKSHVTLGAELLKRYRVNVEIVQAVIGHHEREDGSGYPNGRLDQTELSKLLAVCDVFDAMTEVRAYRKAVKPMDVIEMMKNGQLGYLNKKYISALMSLVIDRKNIAKID